MVLTKVQAAVSAHLRRRRQLGATEEQKMMTISISVYIYGYSP